MPEPGLRIVRRDGVDFAVEEEGFPYLDRPILYRAVHRFLDFHVDVECNTEAFTDVLRLLLGDPVSTPSPVGERGRLTMRLFAHDEPPFALPQTIRQFVDDQYLVVNGSSFGLVDCRRSTIAGFVTPAHLHDSRLVTKELLGRLLTFWLLRQRGLYAMHSSAVGTGDRFLLLAGARGAGKSTLAYACVRQGMTMLADDLVVRYVGDPGGRVCGAPGVVFMAPEWASRYPELATIWANEQGAQKLPVDLRLLWPERLRTSGALQAIVFVARTDTGPTSLEQVDPEECPPLELRYLSYAHERGHDAQLDADADSVLAPLPVLRLESRDPDEGAAALLDFAHAEFSAVSASAR